MDSQILLLSFYHRKFLLNAAYLLNGAVSWTNALTLKKQLQTLGKNQDLYDLIFFW